PCPLLIPSSQILRPSGARKYLSRYRTGKVQFFSGGERKKSGWQREIRPKRMQIANCTTPQKKRSALDSERSAYRQRNGIPRKLLLGGFKALAGFEEQIDLLVAGRLRGLGQAIATAHANLHASHFHRLVGGNGTVRQRALDLL